MFPELERETIYENEFSLRWQQHGGSGLAGMDGREYESLSIEKRNWLLDRVNKQRKEEAAKIRAAYRKR